MIPDRPSERPGAKRADLDRPFSAAWKAAHTAAAMALRIRLPGGTLKVKVYRELRDRERDRRVPVLKLGSLYFVWSSARHHPHKHGHTG